MCPDYCIIGAYISFFCTNEWWAITGNNILCFFEGTLQPLCSTDRDSGIFCIAAKALFIAVKGLSTAAKICGCCSPVLLQLFCSASWSHSAVLQQRCSFRTGSHINVSMVSFLLLLFHFCVFLSQLSALVWKLTGEISLQWASKRFPCQKIQISPKSKLNGNNISLICNL